MSTSLEAQRTAIESIAIPETQFLPPHMGAADWNCYLSELDRGQRGTVAKQDALLSGFALRGSIRAVAPGANITRQQVYIWLRDDMYHFKSRYEQAANSFRDRLQDIAVNRIEDPTGNRGSDVLLMALLNAHWPEKYRRDSVIVNIDVAKDVLTAIDKLTAQRIAQAVTVEAAPVTAEGQVAKMLGSGKH